MLMLAALNFICRTRAIAMIPNLNHLTIAVVGATGAVGAEFLKIVEQRHPNLHSLKLLASSRSAGTKLVVNGKEFTVEEATEDSFQGVDIAFISASTEASRHWAPIAVAAGAVVIDDSSAFRMQEDVPLVVPEVNGADVTWHQGIIAIPNCSTTPLVMVAHPIHRVNPIKRIVADTYQSVSGAGGAAVQELREQSLALLNGQAVKPEQQPKQIGFNVIPQIDSFLDNGYTREEQKMIDESRKIMHAPDIRVSATCVRVPVMVSHSAGVHLELERAMDVSEIRALLSDMPGLTVLDNPGQGDYPMPWDVAGEDDVFVGRIRRDASDLNGIALWIVSDNLRKGAALNSIQIAEELVARECLKPGATPKAKFSHGEPESLEAAEYRKDMEYFRANVDELLPEFRGKYVAIINQTVIDSDVEYVPLLDRVHGKYGDRPVVIEELPPRPRIYHNHTIFKEESSRSVPGKVGEGTDSV